MPIRFAPSAVRFLDQQPSRIRSKLINDIVWLRDNPYLTPDDPSKVPFLAPPVVLRKYRDDFHWIIYYLESESLIVANIGNRAERQALVRS